MSRNILLISYEPLSARLKSYIGQQSQKHIDCLNLPRSFFDEELSYDINEYIRYYENICRYLEDLPSPSLRNYLVVCTIWVDYEKYENWNPLLHYEVKRYRAYPPELLLSWLSLTYPEIRWICFSDSGGISHKISHKYHQLNPLQNLSEIFNHTTCVPLFDSCGFRNRIRKILLELKDSNGRLIAGDIPRRTALAAAIDEESSYAYMNAYTAYRFGCRAWAINSWEMLRNRFEDGNADMEIVFEDLYLNFPDNNPTFEDCQKKAECDQNYDSQVQHLSNLRFRDCLLPLLKKVNRRILVTVGHQRFAPNQATWENNLEYLETLGVTKAILFKPFAGIFDLWKGAGLWNNKKRSPSYLGDYHWPPKYQKTENKGGTHSAPGRLLAIAERLIKRAIKILNATKTVPDAIHAAVLALEAKELLAGKTPTTALEALAIQHQAEIMAESMFYGINYNLNVKDRFRDIEREVEVISLWFNPRYYKSSQVNARLTIIENLAKIFRELNQFEEEADCLVEARKLSFNFWVRQKIYRWLAWPFLKYIEYALKSLPHLIFVVLLWLIFFTIVYFFSRYTLSDFSHIWDAASASTTFFFTLEPAKTWPDNLTYIAPNWWNIVLGFQGLVSFSNLSLLFAHLYMIVSRK